MKKDPDIPRKGNARSEESGRDLDEKVSVSWSIPVVGLAFSAPLQAWAMAVRKTAPKLALTAAVAAVTVVLMFLLGLVNLHKAQNQRPASHAGPPQVLDF